MHRGIEIRPGYTRFGGGDGGQHDPNRPAGEEGPFLGAITTGKDVRVAVAAHGPVYLDGLLEAEFKSRHFRQSGVGHRADAENDHVSLEFLTAA